MKLDKLAEGVDGYTVDRGDEGLYVPFIAAEVPGHGDVRAFLNALPQDRIVKFPGVISGRLYAMLARRGFKSETEWAEEMQEWVEVMVRRP